MKQHKPIPVYIEAMCLTSNHMSGVGHLVLNLLEALSENAEFNEKYSLRLLLPFNKVSAVTPRIKNIKADIVKMPLPARAIELLMRLRLLPPVDIFFGKGKYVFPNYKNWPLIRSTSYTYIHDLGFIKHPQFVQLKNLAYLKKYIKLWVRRADHIVAISKNAKQEIQQEYSVPDKDVTVVYPGIETAAFGNYTRTQTQKVRKKHKLGNEDYLLFVGNLEPRKNLARLIKAFLALPSKDLEVTALVIVGAESWLSEDLFRSIKKAQNANAKIYIPQSYVSDEDLAVLFAGAKGLVHPALYEGFGIPPLEAMASGVPVAISNIEPMPEVVQNAGLLFDPYDTKQITAAMLKLIRDDQLRKELIKAGYKRSRQLDRSQEATSFTKLMDKQL